MTRVTTRIAATTIVSSLVLASVLATAPLGARADDEDPGVARIGLLSGGVDVKRSDSGETLAAAANAPLNVGDYLTTQSQSRTELQLDNRTALRVGENTQLRFTNMTSSSNALQLAQGTVELRLFHGVEAHPEVDTPNATVRPDDNGRYRVTVDGNGNTFVTARSGAVDVVTQSATQTLDAGSTLEITGDGAQATVQTVALVPPDGFDRWNEELDHNQADAQSYVYTDPNIVGAGDLDRYGSWSDVAGYGEAWRPSYAAGWSPYHDGRWVWEPYYGWTWVSDEPWGWAPYHYGRWFYANQGWYWYPGVSAYQPAVYRPALVAFFSFGLGGGGLNLGFGNVGWVPLAPYETFHPWWGGTRYYNRTTVVNNVTNVKNVTNSVTNVTIYKYKNIHAPGGAVAVENGNFARGNFRNVVAVSPQQLRSASAVQGVVPIVPTHQNLALSHAPAPVSTRPVAPAFDRFAAIRGPATVQSFSEAQAAVKTLAQRQYPEHAATFEKASGTGDAPAASGSRAPVTSPWERFNTAPADQRNASTRALPQKAAAQGPQHDATPRGARATPSAPAARLHATTPTVTAAPSDAWKRFDASHSGPATTLGASPERATTGVVRPQTYGTTKVLGAPVSNEKPVESHQPVQDHQPAQAHQPMPYREQTNSYRAAAPPVHSNGIQPSTTEASHHAVHAQANDSEKPSARPKPAQEQSQQHEQQRK